MFMPMNITSIIIITLEGIEKIKTVKKRKIKKISFTKAVTETGNTVMASRI